MEVDKIQTQACKFSRVANGRIDSNKIGLKGTGGGSGGTQDYPDEEEDGEVRQSGPSITIGGARGRANGVGELGVEGNRLRVWQPPSRILRVSRASGGKDRHSKVLTAKGPRDRRVRLSVHTAIQFYDLQDRLGFDQPSKAVEWLIKAAADHIAELPSLDTTYLPHTSRQANEREPNLGAAGALQQELNSSAHLEINSDPNLNQTQQQNQHGSFSKSACSSNTSDTSKGSGLSLSRSEIRVKARERARERAKEKEKENESINVHHNNNAVNSLPQSSSFTQLLTAGINNAMNQNGGAGAEAEPRLFHKPTRANNQWLSGSAPMDYFSGTGLLGSSSSSRPNHTSGSGFSLQTQMGNSMAEPVTVSPFSVVGGEHHNPELQQFSFSSDHLVQVANTAAAAAATAAGNDYNLNFTVSSSPAFAGFNRGTLQSNSPSLFPYLQRLSPTDGSGVPFFLGTAAVSSIVPPPMENSTLHHHHQQFVPSGLQLCYGTGGRQSDHKGKGKN